MMRKMIKIVSFLFVLTPFYVHGMEENRDQQVLDRCLSILSCCGFLSVDREPEERNEGLVIQQPTTPVAHSDSQPLITIYFGESSSEEPTDTVVSVKHSFFGDEQE